ncbi:MAG: ribonuclease HI family protein [Patescibacteria group bacterium]
MVLTIYTDGGSKGNPGPASIGIVMYEDGKEVLRYREDIGVATNNDAEYRALLKALELITDKSSTLHVLPASPAGGSYKKLEFYSDSSLMVNQLNGLFKVKNGKIREYISQIRNLEGAVKLPIFYKHIPREENTVADDLVNNK